MEVRRLLGLGEDARMVLVVGIAGRGAAPRLSEDPLGAEGV